MPSTRTRTALTAALVTAAAITLGCGEGGDDSTATAGGGDPSAGLPQGAEHVTLDPSEFTTQIDNPYWPMAPGSRWVYREAEDGTVQKVVVTVTDRTKTLGGIESRVVRDVVTEQGVPIEVTSDYYAQDAQGNIWYMGEDTTEYENGKPTTTAGSFHHGVGGAEAGIATPANPEVGMHYRQEYYAGEAEDQGSVLSVDEQVEVPFGHFSDAVMTRDVNPLEPRVNEHKFYAKGVGPVLTLTISGGSGREDLISYQPG